MLRSLTLAALLTATATTSFAQDWVWVEGEAATEHNFSNKGFPPAQYGDKAKLLSGSDWLNTSGKVPVDGYHASYQVAVPENGTWKLWARKFWKHGPFRWRFDNGDWAHCDKNVGLIDTTELATHICANWVYLGEVTLPAGTHTLRIELDGAAGTETSAAFDCFLLGKGSAQPNGQLKPGERSGLHEEGWWAFEPEADAFAANGFDIRDILGREPAGAAGFVSAKGADFVDGAGKPIRFWATNIGPGIVELDKSQIDYLAERLGKTGFNMVRIHGDICPSHEDWKVDTAYLDKLQYAVAAFKKAGVYSKLSFYFPLWYRVTTASNLPGYEDIDNKTPFAAAYFDATMQEHYRRWASALLTSKNPYGKPLGQEPAVAITELVNEDSVFFWTFSEKNIPKQQWQAMEQRFGAWLTKRYGSVDKAIDAWGGERQDRDNSAAKIAKVMDAWNMTSEGALKYGDAKRKRMGDQVRFLAEVQRDFYASMSAFLKKDCQLGSTVSASNWHVADAHLLDAVERWTYDATDVIDKHSYFGPVWEKRSRNWTVSVGDVLKPNCALLQPTKIPTTFLEYEGHPHIITETGWTTINRFQADESFLFSTVASLQGLDGVFYFAISGPSWATTAPALGVNSPACIGQAPAAALQYRRGDVKLAPEVVHQSVALDDLFALKGAASIEEQGIDGFRQGDIPAGGILSGQPVSSIDPLACYVGRVVRDFQGDPKRNLVTDLSPYIDRTAKKLRSQTGEFAWDWGNGVVQVNSPRSQGISGFLTKAGAVSLTDCSIESRNEYGTVHVISLDGQTLAQSKRMLIQVFTEQKMYGWKQDPNGTITDFGSTPIQVKAIDASVTFTKAITRATVLDEHGYPRGLADVDGGRVTLAADAMYVIVER